MKEYRPSDGETSLPRKSSSQNGEVEVQDEDILSEDLERERCQDDKVGEDKCSNYRMAEKKKLLSFFFFLGMC